MHHLSIDIETYSSVPIAKAGLYKYAQSPDFEILLFAYALDGAPVEVIDLTVPASKGGGMPLWLLEALKNPDYIKHAYNAAFEWYCLSRWRRWTLQQATDVLPQWRDTMLHALYCGYPASLDAAGKAMGLPEDKRKMATGKALIKTFCTPRSPTERDSRTRIRPWDEPEKWELFKTYNGQDVATEMEIEQRLQGYPIPDAVQRQWEQDLIVNARGVAVDLDIIEGAKAINDAVTQPLIAEAQRITGLDNPCSMTQVKGWMQNRGYDVTTLRKDDVTDWLGRDELDDRARRVLEIRQLTGKSSITKYQAMDTAVCRDGRVRGTLQFYGANRTGRWAGRILQPQNLPRTYLHGKTLDLARQYVKEQKADHIGLLIGSPPDILSQLIRTAIVPASGSYFIDADFSAIEARVIAWLAGEEWVLDVFRTHGKIYEAQASQMFGIPMERIRKGNPEYDLRQRGKVATLALGYQGSVGALINMGALRMGIPEEDLPEIVQRWRSSNQRIVDLWYKVESAAIDTIRTGRQNAIKNLLFTRRFDPYNDLLTIRLPSGRELFYARPHLVCDDRGRDRLRYWGMHQQSHKWIEVDTYGGKLVENCVQAIARDCLAENIGRLEDAGYRVVFHVHDEVVIEREGTTDRDAELKAVCGIMGQPISWAPGLPLAADGWTGDYYTKD